MQDERKTKDSSYKESSRIPHKGRISKENCRLMDNIILDEKEKIYEMDDRIRCTRFCILLQTDAGGF